MLVGFFRVRPWIGGGSVEAGLRFEAGFSSPVRLPIPPLPLDDHPKVKAERTGVEPARHDARPVSNQVPSPIGLPLHRWGRGDSNSHSVNRNLVLNQARLPIPPRPHGAPRRGLADRGWSASCTHIRDVKEGLDTASREWVQEQRSPLGSGTGGGFVSQCLMPATSPPSGCTPPATTEGSCWKS